MARTLKMMMDEANAAVPRLTVEDARAMISTSAPLIVDVRDAPEVAAQGKVVGAVHVSRGMLEFRADPASPYHDAHFDPARPALVYCASGGRSALAGKVLKDMGYDRVFNIGGFKDWVEAGGEIDRPVDPGMG